MRTIITITASFILSGFGIMAQTWTQYQSSDTSISKANVADVTFDQSNNMWMASDKGIIKFDGSTWTQFLHVDTNMNNSSGHICASTKSNDIWITYYGTYLGVYQTGILSKFDGTTWTKFTPSNSTIPFIPSGVTNIDVDTTGTVWVSCREGILNFNGTTWSHFDSTDFNTGQSEANCVIDPKTNTPWALVNKAGIPAHMELSGGSWSAHNNNGQMIYTLAANGVSIIIDGLGDQYIACWWADDLYKFSSQTNQYDSIRLTDYGAAASAHGAYSSNNHSYIPSWDSVLVYNWATKTMKAYSNPAIAGGYGYMIFADKTGQKWLVGGAGVQSLTLTKFEETYLSSEEIADPEIGINTFPNPFTNQFAYTVVLGENQQVNIGIYNMLGALVESVHVGTLTAGTHQLQHQSNLPSGMYMLRVETQNGISTQQLIKSN